MELIIFLFISAPVVLGVWLIVRAVSAKSRIEELTRRVDDLQSKVARLTRPPSAVLKTAEEETASAFTSASLLLQKIATETTPPAATVEAEFPRPSAVPPFKEPAPEITAPPVTTPPPIIPPIPPKSFPTIEPTPEPVFGNAKASAPAAETVPPPVVEKASFELRLGTFWLVRIGIVMLLTGLAFFANYAYHHIIGKLGPAGKISLLYLASGLLLGAGAWWQRRNVKESLKNYGQVLFAGGLAAVYFTTYAAHHIPPLRVIVSALADGILLLAWAGVIAWMADRRKSEVMALFAIGLAFFTSVITRVGEFTLYSNLILTVVAVVFLVRNRWAALSFASLITSYAGYAFWRFLHDDGWRWAAPGENLWLGAGFLACYWLVFTAATFLSKREKLSGPNRAAFLTLNNGAFFALFLLTMIQVQSGGFWKFSFSYGAGLLALAIVAKKFLPAEPLTKNAYLTQGLLLVTLGIISKFAGLQLALILGVESVVLFVLGSQRQSVVLKIFSFATAALATGWCAANLKEFDYSSLWTGASLGAILTFNAFWAHRQDAGKSPSPLRAEPTGFTLLALASWLATTWRSTDAEHLPLVLAVEAVTLTFSIYLLRVREITLIGQSFLVFAQFAWLLHFLNATPPWWNPLVLIAITVGLSHWWQKQKTLVINGKFGFACQSVFALATIALVLVWVHPLVSPSASLALTSLLAVAATIYGVATRVWPLAVCGQIFLAVSAWEFIRQLVFENVFNQTEPEWYFPLVPLAMLGILSFATVNWFARRPDDKKEVREPLLQTALIYRWLALLMSLVWIRDYVPERQRVWAFMAAAVVVFALAVWRCNREALVATAVYVVVSLITLWFHDELAMEIYWPNLVSLLALFVMQQILQQTAVKISPAEQIHGAIIFITGVSLWRFVSCWVPGSGIFLTMSWAGLAVLVFVAGIILRERFHRWFGLGVLAASVGRVVLVDVWKQETIYRVLTFMALGAALLVIGFIYNKYQDAIRKWL